VSAAVADGGARWRGSGQRLGAERARVERVQAGLADGGLRVEEEGASEGRVEEEEGAGADGSFSRLRRRLEKVIFLGP
jgi:hypothetical protein